MLWSRRYDAFISYSHKDNDVVKPLVELLSLNEHRVFWDQHLKAGDCWDQVIKSAVKQSSIFVLFWCCDTRESQYVAEEIALALHLRKKIVPVKLCGAAMPLPLGEWQWIDLGKRVQHRCADVDHGLACDDLISSVGPQARFVPWKRLGQLSFAIVSLLILIIFWMTYSRSPVPPNAPATSSAAPPDSHYSVGYSPALNARATRSAVPQDSHYSVGSPAQDAQVKPSAVPPPSNAHVPLPSFSIPREAVRTSSGYAIVNPPVVGGYGSIGLLDEHGKFITEYYIWWGPLSVPTEFHEAPIPWWYVNRAVIFAGGLFAATILLFTWMSISRRRRADHAFSVTMNYLYPLAHL